MLHVYRAARQIANAIQASLSLGPHQCTGVYAVPARLKGLSTNTCVPGRPGADLDEYMYGLPTIYLKVHNEFTRRW